jgi:DNA (cytosine-5)-methyltransferase 1
VTCVDIAPQPDNPFPFIQLDLRELDPEFLREFDLIHASPPCQRDAAITRGTNQRLRHTYPDLIGPTRGLLEAAGIPYVIENPAARPDVVLCGEMFGLRVIRHRRFELGGWETERPEHLAHRGKVIGVRHGVRITEETGGYYYAVYGNGGYKGTVPQWQDAMGIHWTNNRKSIAEAIPPAYTQWVGNRFTEWSRNHG